MKSRSAWQHFAALAFAASTALVACGDDGESGAGPGRADVLEEAAQRARAGADAVRALQSRKAEVALQRRQTMQQQRRERFAGIDFTEDQQRRLDGLIDDRRSWEVEHQEALRALRDELRAAARAGDAAAREASRARMRALRETQPSLRRILAELSEEQRALFGQNGRSLRSVSRARRRILAALSEEDLPRGTPTQGRSVALRRQQRFAGVGLSEDQQRRLDGLGEARQAWNEEHHVERRALRAEIEAAERSADDVAAGAARARMQALLATEPSMASLIAELSDEQRAQLRARGPRPRPQPGVGDALAGAESPPDDRVAD